jgi:predicted nuclease of predicted toxin-antitoxin system
LHRRIPRATTSVMRILADENIPRPLVHALREQSHDVDWVLERRPGATDHDVLLWARREERAILTFDKDFRDWAFRSEEPMPDGCILLQIDGGDGARVVERTIEALKDRTDCRGTFIVVTERRTKARSI